MRKLILIFTAMVLVILAACTNESPEDENTPVFTEDDIELAQEMIEFINEKEEEFVNEANKQIEENNIEYHFSESHKLQDDFLPLAQEIIVDPLLEQYGDHIVGYPDKEFKTMINSKGNELIKTFDNLTLEEPQVTHHQNEVVDMQELKIPVNEDETKIFDDASYYYYEYTFYKSEDDNLIVGSLYPLTWNAHILDFEVNDQDDIEELQEEIDRLPALQ